MANEYRTFGPPGTGKTTWTARQVERAVSRYGPDGVLVASFTKAAAVELAGRDLPIAPKNLGTLHALCYRELGAPTIAETKIAEFNKWQTMYQLSDGGGFDLDEPEQRYDDESDRIFAQYQTVRAKMLNEEQWPMEVRGFAHNWEAWKRMENYVDFTDMIALTLETQSPPPGRATVGFFDEVQDFTPLELAVVRLWGEYMDMIVLAGDDDQCIYGFKGSTPTAFLEPEISPEQIRILSQSWRLPRAIHAYSQAWISRVRARQQKDFTPRDADGNVNVRPELYYRNPSRVVDEILEVADTGTVMAIAACSYQIAPIVNELRNRGELFHNPYRRKRGDWNPLHQARPGQTTTKDRLISLSIPHQELWGETARQWTWGDARKFVPLFRKTGVVRRGASKMLESPPSEQEMTYDDLNELFEESALMPLIKLDLRWVQEHASSDKKKALEYPIKVAQKKGFGALMRTPNITVGTIHSVKGGEADSVYLFPDLSRAGYMEWEEDRSRDGIMRQFYVGMTRAKSNLTLCGQSFPTAVQW